MVLDAGQLVRAWRVGNPTCGVAQLCSGLAYPLGAVAHLRPDRPKGNRSTALSGHAPEHTPPHPVISKVYNSYALIKPEHFGRVYRGLKSFSTTLWGYV